MNLKLLKIAVILILCLCFLKFYHARQVAERLAPKIYGPTPLTLVIDWEIEEPFELQIFYTTEQNARFHERQSIKKKVTPENKHVEVILPVEKIYKFRIDFGSNPEKILLKNVEIKADQYINFNDWYGYAYKNIEKNKVNKENNTLTIISNHQDPYMFWIDPFVLYKNKK